MSNLEKSAKLLETLLDQRLNSSERAIGKRYALLLDEIRKELAKLFELYEKDGVLTYAEMAKYDRLKKLLAYINQLLESNYKGLKALLYGLLSEVYQEGYYRTAWAIETDSLSRLSYFVATPETITAMIENPVAGLTLPQTLEKNRINIVYKIQQEITQSLVKGESYKNMASRLKKAIEVDATKAMRIARTEAHRVSESSKHDSAEHANKNGIIMMKEWNSSEDERVRNSALANHRKLNGKKIPVTELFKQGRGLGKGPGMMLAPEHDINDRCFLTYSIKKVEKVDVKELEDITFETWKKERLKPSK